MLKRLKKSPFLHIVPVSDIYVALYNSLNLEVAFVKKSFIEQCQRGEMFVAADTASVQILQSLEKLGLLIEKEADGYELYREYQRTLEEPAINILYLLLTDACNIHCRYCYFLAHMPHDYQFSFMKRETVIAALNLFARCVKRSIVKGHPEQHIVIYGGEPTLNKEVLLETLKYIDTFKRSGSLPETTAVTINTNGILLDEEILTQCKASEVVVSLSLDGPKEIHDQMRVYPSGKGTFDEVIRSYHLAQQLGVKIGICVTIDRHNIFQMKEIVQWLVNKLKVKGIGFNILIENGADPDTGEYAQYGEIVAQELIESFKIAREKGVYEDRMMRRVKSFIDKMPVVSDCGGCGLQIVVGPDGEVGTCQAFWGQRKFFVSEPLETFEPESHPFWKQWRRRSPFTNEKCRHCIALGNCGGGCPYNAYQFKGSIDALDERFCAHARSTIYFLIQDLWKKQASKRE